MNIYALTPTGARPEGLALLAEYINSQTYRGFMTWVIVDDCTPATKLPKARSGIDIIRVRPEWTWRLGMNTQIQCMRRGLEEVPENAVLFIFEDDDIYLPGYMETSIEELDSAELVGEIDSRYYNVETKRWKVIKGRFHSSLSATACRGGALKFLRKICDSGIIKMLDFKLWKEYPGAKKLMHSQNVISIKGLPGRPGIGVGHRNNFGDKDTDNQLKKWAGSVSDNYGIFAEAP